MTATTTTASFTAFGKLRSGTKLDGYTIVRMAGRGGMAVVWEARDPDGKRVALKTMLPTATLDPAAARAFTREGTLAKSVDHDNVCAVVASGEANGIVYLVMDWVDGASLATLLEHGPIPRGVAVRIIADVARGLHAAHLAKSEGGESLGIVHRDVSPQNILVGKDGVAKIADFGIAYSSASSTANVVKGKARYMAPEQAYGEAVDARTDIFALGIVLYEATTGRPPYVADNDVAILAKLVDPEPVPPPGDGDDDFPTALRDAIVRATSKESEARYTSMADFANALDTAGTSPPEDVARFVEALPAIEAPREEASAPSRSRVPVIAAAIALAGVTTFGVVRHLRAPPDEDPSPHGDNNAIAHEPSAAAPPAPTESMTSTQVTLPTAREKPRISIALAGVDGAVDKPASSSAPSTSASVKPFSAEALRTRE